MHSNTSDGAAKALHNLQVLAKRNATGYDLERDHEEALIGVAPVRTVKDKSCPDCGSLVINWYSANLDPGDVDPRADCTNPDCGWGY